MWDLPPAHITRIITFLVGNPINFNFLTVTGWGGRSNIYVLNLSSLTKVTCLSLVCRCSPGKGILLSTAECGAVMVSPPPKKSPASWRCTFQGLRSPGCQVASYVLSSSSSSSSSSSFTVRYSWYLSNKLKRSMNPFQRLFIFSNSLVAIQWVQDISPVLVSFCRLQWLIHEAADFRYLKSI